MRLADSPKEWCKKPARQPHELMQKHDPQGVVVDADGLGVGTHDTIKNRGYGRLLHEFHGGGKPIDKDANFNKRAEVWKAMADWLKAGHCQIPDNPEFETDLTGTQ